jgi:hypothetical protein
VHVPDVPLSPGMQPAPSSHACPPTVHACPLVGVVAHDPATQDPPVHAVSLVPASDTPHGVPDAAYVIFAHTLVEVSQKSPAAP